MTAPAWPFSFPRRQSNLFLLLPSPPLQAHIIVELPRQRGILLGKGGAAIKALSTASRKEIEEFVGRPVFLQLSVKVVEGWRKDPQQLERLGY